MLQLIATALALKFNSHVILVIYGAKLTIPTNASMAFPHLLVFIPLQLKLTFHVIQLKILVHISHATKKQDISLYLESINVSLV